LVVDNGSQDSSIDQISAAHPGIQIECLSSNLGFAGGYNAGIAYALKSAAEHIFLLNNDTTLDPDAIRNLLASGWDVAIPKILFYDQPTKIWAAGARWRRFPPSVVMNGYRRMDGPRYDRSTSLTYATGCAILARRKVFESVGGFDPEFVNYMEDYDLFYRIHSAGYKVGYVPEARIYHKVSQTLGHQSPARWRYLGLNTARFYRKHNRFPVWMLWSYLAWFTLREVIKRNTGVLPDFWVGVREGLRLVKEVGKASHGTRAL
jgi:GT2 family glycosyltransferase